MKAVLVTGSTGNVGVEVVMRLLKSGTQVHAAVFPGRGKTVPEGAYAVPLDFEDSTTFAGALDGVDRVFLLRPPQMSDAHAMRPFIDAIREARIKQVVFLSVQGAGSNPFVPHHGIEQYLKKSGLNWTFLRPSFFMQNLSTTHRADICERDEVYVPAGKGRTNFIDVADIGEAAAVVLTTSGHDHKSYELTGDQALTYTEVAETLSKACGRQITYPRPSSRQFKERMKAAGHDDEFISVMGSIYAIAKFGMAAGTTDEFQKLVGHKPTTLAEWAKRNRECFEPVQPKAGLNPDKPMLVTVFGASGQTGRLVVAELLDQGHSVRAFLRDPSRLNLTSPRLELVEGNALDEKAVDAAIQGAGAVISALGSTRKEKHPVFSAAIKLIINSMGRHDLKPIAVISAQGVGSEPDDGLALPLRIFRALLGEPIRDMRRMEDELKACDLDWTIIRPGGLYDGPIGAYEVKEGNAIKGGGRTRRADLADALVIAVTKNRWPRKAMSVASRS
jgi:uncharacterized protein YbjT (DUF2867 family)